MYKFNRLTEVLAVATLVLLGHPDTARAQLIFNPSSVTASIPGPGGTYGPAQISVSSASAISSLVVAAINTSDRTNWLCATPSGTTLINVYVGTGGCSGVTSTGLIANGNYSGFITVQANGAQSTQLTVSLSVGNSGGTNTVVANPSTVTFNAQTGGLVTPQRIDSHSQCHQQHQLEQWNLYRNRDADH